MRPASYVQQKEKVSGSIKRKLEIIVNSLPPDKKKKDVASEYGIAPSTLSTILKDKEKLRPSAVVGNFKKKRHRDLTRPEIDTALFQWFTATRAQSIPISGEILKAKAEELSKESDESDSWICSSGWLS